MLRWRLLLGTLLVGLMILLCWLDSQAELRGAWLFPLVLVIALAATGEMLWMLGDWPSRPIPWVVYLGNAAIVCANWLPLGREEPIALTDERLRAFEIGGLGIYGIDGHFICAMAAVSLSILLAFAVEIFRYRAPGLATARLAATTLVLTYIGLMMSFVIQLRMWGPGMAGIIVLASLILTVKLGDIGAYTVGRLIGRHRMAPLLSPGKTIEGGLGAVVFACLGAWLSLRVLWPWAVPSPPGESGNPFTVAHWLSYGVLIGLVGLFGDLAESLLKRDLGRKDSSAWLPGFGGVLDIIDSILLAGPLAFLWWLLAAGPIVTYLR